MTDYKQQLLDRLHNRTAKVGVVGMGYVGLPLAVEFARAGYHVVGLDVLSAKVDKLNAGVSYIPDVPTETLAPLVENGHLCATTSYDDLRDADVISICVPTPLLKTKDPDMSYVIGAADDVAKVCHAGLLVVLESTTYPGTTEEVIAPRLVNNGLTIGQDVFVAFSPERVDPGNPVYHTTNIPKVVGGITPACTELAALLYGQVMEKVVPVSSARVAETVKLLENTFRSVNIGLVNEIAMMCDTMDIDVWEVIDAAASKPFGFLPFYPGPGLGGHCIPIDPFYLAWKAKLAGSEARFIELAGQINKSMPLHVVKLITAALNRQRKAVNGSQLLVVGVAYKGGIDDTRESPALDIIELLARLGAKIQWYDPHVMDLALEVPATRLTNWDQSHLTKFDLAVIVTAHPEVNHKLLLDACPAVVDTRNALKGHQAPHLTRL
jgi:UDP-N-acetyl-D-glucosamine dehydrogenase